MHTYTSHSRAFYFSKFASWLLSKFFTKGGENGINAVFSSQRKPNCWRVHHIIIINCKVWKIKGIIMENIKICSLVWSLEVITHQNNNYLSSPIYCDSSYRGNGNKIQNISYQNSEQPRFQSCAYIRPPVE